MSTLAELSSVLIVENDNGNVFILDNEKEEEKAAKPQSSARSSRLKARKRKLKSSTNNKSVKVEIKEEFKNETVVEHLDDEEEKEFTGLSAVEPKTELFEASNAVFLETKVPDPPTFNGDWSDNDAKDDDKFFAAAFGDAETSKKKRKPPPPKKLANPGEVIECKYCDTQFTIRRELMAHQCKYLKCNLKNFICRFCDKELSKKVFSDHIKDVKAHPNGFNKPKEEEVEVVVVKKPKKPRKSRGRRIFECDFCGKTLKDRRDFEKHLITHSDDANFVCETCGSKYFTKKGFDAHSCDKPRPANQPRVQRYCSYCDSHFASFDERKAHVCPYLHPDDPKLVICRFCDKPIFKSLITRHIDDLHSGKLYICTVCKIPLMTARNLRGHMETHTGHSREYSCHICSETFKKKLEHIRHMRIHGIEEKTFHCEFCFNEFASANALRTHVSLGHHTIKKRCEICKAEFDTREEVREHIDREHEPSTCKFCHKSFKTPSSLSVHVKVHFRVDENDLLPCQHCHKMIRGPSNLKRHESTHFKERVLCTYCSGTYTFDNLRAHVKRKHIERLAEFDSIKPAKKQRN